MHNVIVIAIGLTLLGLCLVGGRALGGSSAMATAALAFLPIWLAGAAINMMLGVKRAGYSVADEAPILVVVFIVPAAVALVIWWKLRAP
jgi:hypothetical protein